MSYVKMCNQCKKAPQDDLRNGFYEFISEDTYICPICHGKLVDTLITRDEYLVIIEVSNDTSFIQEMMNLKDIDPIEYQLKIQQFKTQLQQQVSHNTVTTQNVPHCPTCNSTNIRKISGISKAGSIAVWGIFSRKVHKQWRCNNCGSEW